MSTQTAVTLSGMVLVVLSACAADVPATKPAQVIPLDGVEGRIDHLAVDDKAGRMYVAALGNDTVEVIDLTAGKQIERLKGLSEPQGIAVVPDTQQVIVASGKDGKCRIYDKALKLQFEIGDLDDADNVRYDAKAKQAIVGYGEGALAVIDVATGKKLSEIKLDGHPESFQLEPNGRRIFVNVPHAQHVAVVDRDKGAVIAKWKLPDAKANFPMALDEANHRLFVGCRNPSKLMVLNTETGKVAATVDIVGDTDDIFCDQSRKQLYVSGGEGRVDIVIQSDADNYTLRSSLKTPSGARTSLVAAGSASLYLAVPHRGQQQAQIQVFDLGKAIER